MIKEVTMWETSDRQRWSHKEEAEAHEKRLNRDKHIPIWVIERLKDGYTESERHIVADVLFAYGDEIKAILEGRKPQEMPRTMDDILEALAKGQPAFPERRP